MIIIPKISIIIPCYNSVLSLSKCVESVLMQSFIDFEILLLNDGSTDNTLAICDDFQKNDRSEERRVGKECLE